MRARRQFGGLLAAAALLLGAALPATALASEIIAPQHEPPQATDGWQAGTCNSDVPTCSIETPTQYFEQAAGHPQIGFTQIIVKHTTEEPLPGTTLETPDGELKTVRVDLPVGLSVNPQATEQCPRATFESNPSSCPTESAVGKSFVTPSLAGVVGPPIESVVYNIVPDEGEPARFGFELAGKFIYLRADVAWRNDYHEGFTIDVPQAAELAPVVKGLVLKQRLVFGGRSGDGTFITTPTTCLDPTVPPNEHTYSTWLRADSYQEPEPEFPNGSPLIESKIPPGTFPKECSSVPFEPSLEVEPGTAETDSPAGASVNVEVPVVTPTAAEKLAPLTKQASSHVRNAVVTMPVGMGLNPSAASGLLACTDAEFGKGTANPVACPAASKIGTVSVETPPLPPESLAGNVYLGKQLSRDPTSGQEYRIFVDIESARFGISARLIGNVAADPHTGQLVTTFAENPQVPLHDFRLQFNGGPQAPLTSPPTCGPFTTSSEMTPWSGNAAATPASEFSFSKAPGGGACPKTLAARPFSPGFAAHSADSQAGAYSAFEVQATREAGQQELKGIEVKLPPGLTGKLAGLTYCPEAAIAAAEASGGAEQAAAPSCPASSFVGMASVLAGSGSAPIHIDGKAFLAGPYRGAPLSLAVITPATAGPFDLGTTVVRVALFVDPETARITAVSDPIPHIFGGTLLDIRSVALNMSRPHFQINPTNCSPMSVDAKLLGGGANPLDPAAFVPVAASAPFQASGCDKLGFSPKLELRALGSTQRTKNPELEATFLTHEGDANPARVAVTLPRAIILDQANIGNVCTRVQFAANACPSNSVYGYARAFTPLLDKPLEGPVYLRSSEHQLPDIVAALHGQVDINLVGVNDSVNGQIRNTFEAIPDVPVSKFVLTVHGGPSGLLINSKSLCPREPRHRGRRHHRRRHRHAPLTASAEIVGQNGKTANQSPVIGVECGHRRHHRHHRHHHRHHR